MVPVHPLEAPFRRAHCPPRALARHVGRLGRGCRARRAGHCGEGDHLWGGGGGGLRYIRQSKVCRLVGRWLGGRDGQAWLLLAAAALRRACRVYVGELVGKLDLAFATVDLAAAPASAWLRDWDRPCRGNCWARVVNYSQVIELFS